MTDYDAYITDQDGVVLYGINHYISIEYVLVVNEVGSCTLIVPGDISGNVNEDYRLKLYRNGVLVGQTQFIIYDVIARLSENGEVTTELVCNTANVVLKWPTVYYAPGLLPSHHNDYAGNAIKQMVRQNIGSLAEDSARDMSTLLDIEADANDGEIVIVDVGWLNMLEAIKTTASVSEQYGTRIVFDVIENGSGKLELITLETLRGSDLTASILLTPDHDNFTSVSLRKNYSEASSRVFVGGTGQELWRLVVPVANTAQANNSPWGYIKEHFHANDRVTTTAEAQVVGSGYLVQHRNRISISGKPSPSAAIKYGDDYNWGDKVAMEFMGQVAELVIDKVNVVVKDGQETVTIDASGDAS